jgi:biopolymer transport protein ExbB
MFAAFPFWEWVERYRRGAPFAGWTFFLVMFLLRKDHIMGVSAGPARPRLIAIASICLVALLVGTFFPGGNVLRAQDDANGEKAAPAPAPAGGEADKKAQAPGLFKHIIVSAGPVFGLLLLAISIALVTVIVLLFMDLRMGSAIPPYFVEEFTDTVNKRQFKQAFELSRNESSYLGRVLTAGMGRLQYGIEDSREAAFNMGESIKAGKDQLIAYLATIGTLGPMIGLVGTVFGMIQSFMVLAVPGSNPKPDELAKGISHALVVTLLGIGLSVPAIFFHAFFRNRLIRISMDVANIADDLLTQMYHNSKKPAGPEVGKPGSAPGVTIGNSVGGAVNVKPAP